MASNYDVARAWHLGRPNTTRSMFTDGANVYSYAHRIGTTRPDGTKVALCCHYSMTTAHHLDIYSGGGKVWLCYACGHRTAHLGERPSLVTPERDQAPLADPA